ncbi:MAG TPA: nucleoside triphosphate pyrophosphohydrolase [Planctomycetaceae bacterium]|jgi:tetrapyrrole methylase family protein/MazG family protein|nr:nucleoside triphosphate pyrophosphohydrolase [Planctomycetaceae bacterium]
MPESASKEQSPSENAPGRPPDPARMGPAFRELCEVVARLRSPTGCPWDRVQTLESIKPYTLEETYELLEAIDARDDDAIAEELGDLLLQVVLDAQIAADEGRFDLLRVVEGITRKMIERHPHVFGSAVAHTAADVSQHWDVAKKKEKSRDSLLDGIPLALPQLARATKLSKKAARVGYDFPDRAMLFDKLREELAELANELFPDGLIPQISAHVEAEPVPDVPIDDPARRIRVEDELGDLLFVVANIARRWKIDPEEALRRSNAKFERRFRYIEQQLAAQNRTLAEASLIEMEKLYQQGKRVERGQQS